MSDFLELDGCRVLVTGGTKGIGEAVAARLREAGATVLTTARTAPHDFKPQDLFVAADITTAQGCTVVADAVIERLGGIDITVHVVGGSSAPPGGFPCSTMANGNARLTSIYFLPSGWIAPSCPRCSTRSLA
jgi:NAD(P)-dependent dehydrogenase (short-subunit alcohol dehydrogenase family)